MARFQRPRGDGAVQRTTALELFYDLAFVFAITQVSHLLLGDLTWHGAGQATIVLLALWWAWNYTTWATNELDPESPAVRMLLLAIMLASLLLAVAIPEAFGTRSLLFAGSYVAIQIGRYVFLTFASAEAGTIERARAMHILIWFIASGVLWIAGGAAGGTARTLLWLGALLIDYLAPALTYRVPGLPSVPTSSWNVQTSHFAERFQLFIILALGESIVITGATTSHLSLDAGRVVAFALAFAITATMWWLYFSYAAGIAERRLELAADRVPLARDAYTYLHVFLAAGVIVSAVGDELVIARPAAQLDSAGLLVVAGGPALYLLGLALFRLRMAGSVATKRLIGAAVCLVLIPLGHELSALAFGTAHLRGARGPDPRRGTVRAPAPSARRADAARAAQRGGRVVGARRLAGSIASEFIRASCHTGAHAEAHHPPRAGRRRRPRLRRSGRRRRRHGGQDQDRRRQGQPLRAHEAHRAEGHPDQLGVAGQNPHNVHVGRHRSKLKTKGSYALSFRRKGTYKVYCSIHRDLGMKMTVVVK